jgi:hypothetical protein
MLLGSLAGEVYGAGIYRWIDDQGRVQYSDSVPASEQSKAESVDVKSSKVSDAQRREAQTRVAKERELSESLARHREAAASKATLKPVASAVGLPPATKRDAGGKAHCEEEWRKYQESQACFAPFRTATGGIKAEAFQRCIEVKQPAACE